MKTEKRSLGQEQTPDAAEARKRYEVPRLVLHGKISEVTGGAGSTTDGFPGGNQT